MQIVLENIPSDIFVPPSTRPFSSWPAQGRPAGYFSLPLGEEASEFYRENGFIVVENCIDAKELEELRRETVDICSGRRGDVPGVTGKGAGETDDDVLKRYLCVHFPHKLSTTMKRYVAHPSYESILTRLIGPNVKCMQSMLFIKASGKPGQAWHQDEHFIPTRDRSLTGGWLAMDDATVENGCLWVLPGSHKRGILWPQKGHQDRRFDCAGLSYNFPYRDEESIPVEVKAGSIVFFNGYLLHRSLPNYAASGYRRVLVNHYMSAESLLPWRLPIQGESMATCDSRDILMVTGEDPYAWKGFEEYHGVFVRPSGEGGCVDSRTNTKSKVEAPPMGAGGGQMGGAPRMGGDGAAMGGGAPTSGTMGGRMG